MRIVAILSFPGISLRTSYHTFGEYLPVLRLASLTPADFRPSIAAMGSHYGQQLPNESLSTRHHLGPEECDFPCSFHNIDGHFPW